MNASNVFLNEMSRVCVIYSCFDLFRSRVTSVRVASMSPPACLSDDLWLNKQIVRKYPRYLHLLGQLLVCFKCEGERTMNSCNNGKQLMVSFIRPQETSLQIKTGLR